MILLATVKDNKLVLERNACFINYVSSSSFRAR